MTRKKVTTNDFSAAPPQSGNFGAYETDSRSTKVKKFLDSIYSMIFVHFVK